MCGRGDTLSQSHLCSCCSEPAEPVTVTRYNNNSTIKMGPRQEILLNDVDTQHQKPTSAAGGCQGGTQLSSCQQAALHFNTKSRDADFQFANKKDKTHVMHRMTELELSDVSCRNIMNQRAVQPGYHIVACMCDFNDGKHGGQT